MIPGGDLELPTAAVVCRCKGAAMDNKSKIGRPDRSKINLNEDYEVKYWTRELGVTKEELRRVVEKVGNSAAAVRKELGHLGQRHD
jgi:hypothetical protein